MTSVDVTDLLAGCIAGDDQAQAQFCSEYLGLVRRAVTNKLSRLTASTVLQSDVGDICHEVFAHLFSDECRVLKKLHRPESVDAWLVTVAQNHAADYVRRWRSRMRVRQAVAREVPERYAPRTPRESAVSEETRTLVREGLDALPSCDRLVLELFYIQGMRYAEISAIMSLNINTVSARIHRAKAKLRTILEGRDHEF